MHCTVITPQGVLYQETIDSVIVNSKNNGDFAVLNQHAPVISTIDVGYLTLMRGDTVMYTVIVQGSLEYQDDTLTVIAQEAQIGLEKASAMAHLEEYRASRLELNRQRNIDFLKAEQELKKSIRDAQASRR
jgi:F-type H+-transporting ATPase subunit epsilon